MRKKVHNYTSNLELTSLLIRIKNRRVNLECKEFRKFNRILNKYILWHTVLSDKRYDDTEENVSPKKHKVLMDLKKHIISLSEKTPADDLAYNRFGNIILLMVKHILTKPQFSGYSYKDDFYSDAVYKILKYLGNFDHTMISERSGQPVNAFAYISQIIHNSILFIINTRKKEQDFVREQVKFNSQSKNLTSSHTLYNNLYFEDTYKEPEAEKVVKNWFLKPTDTLNELKEKCSGITPELSEKVSKINICFPKSVAFTSDEYNEIKKLLNQFKILNLGDRYECE